MRNSFSFDLKILMEVDILIKVGMSTETCPPSRFFLNNSARKTFIALKLLDFLQVLIMQLLKRFHWNILKNEGAGDNFLRLTQEKSQILKSQLSQKMAQKWNILKTFLVM